MKHAATVLRPTHLAWLPVLLFLNAPVSAQQTGTIQGQVVDAGDGRPLSAAQVFIPGTAIGGLTNADGRFMLLSVSPGEVTVRATLLGYSTGEQTVTVRAGEVARVELALEITALAMDELIVTGTGRPTERRRLSADVQVLSAEEIQAAPASDITELLQGRIAGAQVNAVSAQPGTAGLMSFRGPSSAMADQTPVIYIDGVRVDNARGIGSDFGGEPTSALADLAVADIERIEITKGGAASTLYGADAATGVIQIFTKRGGTGEARVTARIEQGMDFPETKFIQDVDFVYPADRFPQLRSHPSWDPNFTKNNLLKRGYHQSYYLSAVGGTPDLGYSVSGRVQHADGVQFDNASTMYNLQSAVQARLTESLTADVSGTFVRHDFNRLPNGTTTTGALTNIEVGDFLAFAGQDNLADALDVYLRQDIDEQVDRYTISSTLGWSPSSRFDARATVGLDKRASEQRHTEDIDMIASSRQGAIEVRTRDFTGLTLDARGTFSYEAPFFTSTSTTVGFQGFRESVSTMSAVGEDLALPGVVHFDAAALITADEDGREVFNGGVFLLQQAGIADQLFLEAGIRFDGNTAFGSNVSYQGYPKLGASFDVASAGFTPDWMRTLRVRANYGVTGKFPPPFLRDRTLEATSFRGESAPRFDNPGNPDLNPERVTTYEVGLDASMWNERLALGITAYRATTTDALFFVNEQPSTGQLSQLRNIGEIMNRGIEAHATVDVVRSPRVDWSLALTWSTLRNEVVDLGGLEPFELSTHGRREFGRIQEGYPVGVRYMGHPVDTNGDGLFDGTERGLIRDPETDETMTPYPTSTGSASTHLALPGLGLSFSVLSDWSRGSTVQDYAAIWSYFNGIPRIEFPMRYDLEGNELSTYNYLDAMNYILVKGDYIKVRELSARYDLPPALAGRLGGDRLSLSLSLRNIYTWVPTPQSIFNPEQSRPLLLDPELHGFEEPTDSGVQLGGSQSVVLPPPTSMRFGIEITF